MDVKFLIVKLIYRHYLDLYQRHRPTIFTIPHVPVGISHRNVRYLFTYTSELCPWYKTNNRFGK